jgi:hypothetical protein
MQGLFTLNNGTRVAVKQGVIDEKEHAYPQTALQALPWRSDPCCEFVHEEHQRDRCNGGRPFGQWPSARPKQRPLSSSAGLLVSGLTTSRVTGGRHPLESFLADAPLAILVSDVVAGVVLRLRIARRDLCNPDTINKTLFA